MLACQRAFSASTRRTGLGRQRLKSTSQSSTQFFNRGWQYSRQQELPWWKRKYYGRAREHLIQKSVATSTFLVIVAIPVSASVIRDYKRSSRTHNDEIHAEEMRDMVNTFDEIRGSAGTQQLVADIANKDNDFVRAVTRFYKQHNPAKVAEAPEIARRWFGRRDALDSALHKKYGVGLHTSDDLHKKALNAAADGSECCGGG